MLGAAKDELMLTGTGAIRDRNGDTVSYREVVQKLGAPIRFEGAYRNFDNGPEAALVAQVAEVEVDTETGQVALKNFTTAHSTGTVINPLAHQGQIDGGVVTAIGYALMEQLTIDQGQVITTNFGENKIPSMRDIPPLTTVLEEFPVGNGPYGGMSIGEPPVLVAAAAIANAVEDAVGVRIRDLPITAEKVLKALQSR
jgi:CO/xanthine dehydrogenase Mo-binding subunit